MLASVTAHAWVLADLARQRNTAAVAGLAVEGL
jgi:hypothetical protein